MAELGYKMDKLKALELLEVTEMQCLNVRQIINKDTSIFTVPCGRCIACRINRTREWSIRLTHESLYWQQSTFLTLTYDDDHISWDNDLSKRDLQLFFKRLRKSSAKKCAYYAVGEYGETYGRPHYHAVLYGFGTGDEDRRLIKESWGKGRIALGTVTYQSTRYVAQYIQKKLYGEKAREVYKWKEPPFALMSKGLGERYAIEHKDRIAELGYVTKNGLNAGLPRYYRKKIGIDNFMLMQNFKETKKKREAKIADLVDDSINEVNAKSMVNIIYDETLPEYRRVKSKKVTRSEFENREAIQQEANIERRLKIDKF